MCSGHFADPSDQDDSAVYFVSPDDIQLRHEFSQAYYGQVLDGDWDLQTTKFEDSVLFFDSFKQRIEQSVAWQDTAYFKDVMQSISKGEARFGCNSEEAFVNYCQTLDALYESIKTQGYKSNAGDDCISINIGRDGQFIFNDGRHRLTIAKLLGLKEIPVKIAVRHRQWVEFKQEIKAFADKFYDGKVYANIRHVDLKDIDFAQHDHRFEVINAAISEGRKDSSGYR